MSLRTSACYKAASFQLIISRKFSHLVSKRDILTKCFARIKKKVLDPPQKSSANRLHLLLLLFFAITDPDLPE